MNTTPALSAALLALSLSPAVAQKAPAPEAFVDALEGVFGAQPGFRRSHAKGVCATGTFVGNAEGRALSQASLFDGARHGAIARFSVGGGNPKVSDKSRSVRGLALQISLPTNETFVTTMISAPVFFVGSPENFPPFFEARRPDPATGMPDPAKVKAFNEAHPDTKPQIDYLAKAPVPASYGAVNYWGVHAFRFANARNVETFAKWRFQPVAGVQGLSPEQMQTLPNDFLADELTQRVAGGAVAFDMILQIGETGDNTVSPVVEWPASRREVVVGRLTIERIDAAAAAACQDVTFIPLNLPKGIAPSDDPVLKARNEAYVVSLSRRMAK
jgi:catalase